MEPADDLPESVLSAESGSACLGLSDRRLEVCTAYVFNSSLAARLPYYKYGRSPNSARSKAALDRLESRYSGSALAQIQAQVRGWPVGETNIDVPIVRVESLSVSTDGNQAVLTTRESWEVKRAGETLLFKEQGARHVIKLERVPGLVLHKWVVTEIA